jgi:hypothetical protein
MSVRSVNFASRPAPPSSTLQPEVFMDLSIFATVGFTTAAVIAIIVLIFAGTRAKPGSGK